MYTGDLLGNKQNYGPHQTRYKLAVHWQAKDHIFWKQCIWQIVNY